MYRKWSVPILWFSLLIFSFLCCPVLFGEEPSKIKGFQEIEWEPVEGANAYRVIIYRGDFSVLDEKVEGTVFKFNLPPGKYRYEVATLNKFGQIQSSTGKRDLYIKKIEPAEFFVLDEPEAFLETEKIVFRVKVKNVMEQTRFFIEKDSGGLKRRQGVLLSRNGNIYTLSFDTKGLIPGRWDLVAENPLQVNVKQKEVIFLKSRAAPGFKSINRVALFVGFIYEDIEIKGAGFGKGTKVEFRKGLRKIEPVEIEIVDMSTLRFKLDLLKATPGIYSVKITNFDGESVTEKRVLNIDYTRESFWDEVLYGFSIMGSFIPFAIGDEVYNEEVGSITIGGELKVNGDFSSHVRFLRWFGGEFRLGLFYDVETLEPFVFGGTGLYFKTRFKSPVNLALKVDLGLGSRSDQYGPAVLGSVVADFNSFPKFVIQLEGTFIYSHFEPNPEAVFFISINLGYRF